MAKNSIRDYSATSSSNTDVQSVNIDENCPASGINNAIREVMVDLKNVSTGAIALESPKFDSILDGNIKATDASGTDAAGTATTIKGGAGTGTGTGGSIAFQVAAPAGSTGSSVNSHATAMTITDGGNVGIGASSPSSTFRTSIRGDGSSIIGGIEFGNAASGGGETFTIGHAGATSTSGKLNVVGAGNLVFATNNTEAARIDSNNGLRVGTTSHITNSAANEKLTVDGGSTGQGATFSTSTSGGFPAMYVRNTLSGSVNAIIFRQGSPSASVGSITMSGGSSTAYNTSSDYRLKENVNYTWDATTRLKQLKPARFNFIVDADTTVDGFLAHEVQTVVPEAITGTKDEVDDDGNAVMQGIDQSKLVPLLVKTILELEARITALETA